MGFAQVVHLGGPTTILLSCHVILVAIVVQNYFVLVFMGYRMIIAQHVAKWGIAQIWLCENKYQVGDVSHHFARCWLP